MAGGETSLPVRPISVITCRAVPEVVTHHAGRWHAPRLGRPYQVPSRESRATTNERPVKERPARRSPFADIARIRSAGPPSSLSASRSQPFLSAPGLLATPFGPAAWITSQTIFTLYAGNGGREGPKARPTRAERRGTGAS